MPTWWVNRSNSGAIVSKTLQRQWVPPLPGTPIGEHRGALAPKTRTATPPGPGLCVAAALPRDIRLMSPACPPILVWDMKSGSLRRRSRDREDLTEKQWPEPSVRRRPRCCRGGDSGRHGAPTVAAQPEIFMGRHTRGRGAVTIVATCWEVGRMDRSGAERGKGLVSGNGPALGSVQPAPPPPVRLSPTSRSPGCHPSPVLTTPQASRTARPQVRHKALGTWMASDFMSPGALEPEAWVCWLHVSHSLAAHTTQFLH